MPKTNFRFRISNILLKRKLFSNSCKSKFNCRNSGKFVWIDGSVKKDWRTLKLKSGYKTDRLFLYYLLHLARRDLLRNGNADKETNDDDAHSKSEKSSVGNEISSGQSWRKCLTQYLEKEKKVHNMEEEKPKICGNEVRRVAGSAKQNAVKACQTVKDVKNSDLKRTKGGRVNSARNSESSLSQSHVCDRSKPQDGKMLEKSSPRKGDEENVVGGKNRKTRKTRQAAVLKNKQPKKGETKVKRGREKFCVTCKLKHSGKCLLERSGCKPTGGHLTGTVNDQAVSDNLFSFDDSPQEEYLERRNKNSTSRKINPLLHAESNAEELSFAKTTLPEYLLLKEINSDHGLSVFTKVLVKKATHFGPLIGQRVKEMEIRDDVNMRDIWEVRLKDETYYISTQDKETSNWLKYIRPADNKESANLMTLVKESNLYFDVVKDISVGEELVYWINDSHLAWSRKKLEKKNCGGCNIQFTHVLYYRQHCMIFHDPSISLTTRKYHCKICGLPVLGKEKIIKHAAEMHHGKGAYQCQYCQKFFLRLNYLEMHRNYGCAENPQRSRPLCDLCGRKFCQPQKLKAHIKRMHSDMAVVLRDFQCKNCQKILGSRAALQRHMKEVHKKGAVGAFTCDRCGKIFQNKSNLKIHMLTHSGVKPFKCQEADCTAAFTTKQCLKFHYKKVHGFSDEVIPKIERSVAYTFDAYSGGAVAEPDQESSPQLDNSSVPILREKNEGVDLTHGIAPQDPSNGKRGEFSPLLPEDPNLIIHLDEKYMYPKTSKDLARKESESKTPTPDDDGIYAQPKSTEKKVWSVRSEVDLANPVFKESSSTSLLVEAAIDAAEKDLIEKSSQGKVVVCPGDDEVMESPAEMYSFGQYENTPCDLIRDPGFQKPQPPLESPKINCFQEVDYKGNFLLREKSNLGEIFKLNSVLRINTSPFPEIQKDCNLVISVRDHDGETPSEEETESGRGRELADLSKGSEGFRTLDAIRGEKFGGCRSVDCDLRLASGVKFEYGDVDFSNEYRSLEKLRSVDQGLHKGNEGYERMAEVDKEGGAENLCLKEKSYQCENLEELAKLGRDASGFDVFAGDGAGATGQSQSFGGLFRSPHGIVSPRSYHPTPFESESVDLSIRPQFSSSPVYTLDLTPSRVDLPTRHLDFRSHLGLPPLRFGSSTSGMTGGDSPQMSSPPGYGIYQSSYGTSPHRPCQSGQFQPYAPLYY